MSDEEDDYMDDGVEDLDGDIESDYDSDSDSQLSEDAAAAAEEETAIAAIAAAKAKEDPILRMSNKVLNIVIIDHQDCKTSNRICKSEVANIISIRTQQIAKSGTHYSQGEPTHDSFIIAKKEFLERRCPLKLRRIVKETIDTQYVEEWDVNIMAHPMIDM
jgi:hypothetical protein